MKRIAWWAAVACALGTTGELSGVDSGVPIDCIEEDWEFVISEPCPEDEAPQILNVLSPNGTQDTDFFVFEMNHSTQPEYTAGGLQLQRWKGDTLKAYSPVPNSAQLSYPNETVSYTLRMRLWDSVLFASARNGHSQTWGDFGGDSLWLWYDTSLSNLNSYKTANSVEKSRIGFASYRVTRFVLKEVRYYSGGQLVQTDTNDYVVHEYEP
jgi:hypothetical protein